MSQRPGQPAPPRQQPDPPLQQPETPSVFKFDQTRFQRNIIDQQAEADKPNLAELIGAGISSGTAIPFALRALERRGFSIDTDFNPFEDDETFKQLTEGLDSQFPEDQ